MNIIELISVTKSYNSIKYLRRQTNIALRDFTFSIAQGEIVGIVGPNGAGKSTMIKSIMGFISPKSGTITVQGHPAGTKESRIGLGYLPETGKLYHHLSLRDHLDFCANLYQESRDEQKRRHKDVIELVGLSDVQNTPVGKFSKGMQQRAALAYALYGNPQILILDEPMSGLDPVGRQLVIDIMKNLNQKGITILFCSHILNDVERICHRIGIMNKGELQRVSTPAQLAVDYQDRLPHLTPWRPVSTRPSAHNYNIISKKPYTAMKSSGLVSIHWAIAKLTVKECLRYRILYGIIIFSLFSLFFALMVSSMFMRDLQKVLLDISLGTFSIALLSIPFFLSISIVSRDLENNTVHTLLAKPVTRSQYITGKFLGLFTLTGFISLILFALILGVVFLAKSMYNDYFFESLKLQNIAISCMTTFVGVMVINCCAIFWSIVTTSSFLATLLTLSTYIIGQMSEDLVRFMSLDTPGVAISPIVQATVKTAMYVFPNLAVFDFKYQAAYGLTILGEEIFTALLYAVSYCVVILLLTTGIFSRRDIA